MSAMLLASTSQSEEGLINPGFESGIEGWASLDAALQTSAQSRSGSASLAMTSTSFEQSVDVFQWKAVQPGWTYEFSAWVVANSPGIDRVFLRISWLNSGYSLISTTDSAWLTSHNPGYMPLSTGFRTAPQGAAMARVGLFVIANSPFTALVDDTNLAALATPAPPTAAPTQPPPPPPPVPTPTPAPNPNPTPRPSTTPRPPGVPGAPTPVPGDTEPAAFDTLTNGSFELIRDDGTAYGWRNIGGQDRVMESDRVSGSQSLELSSSTTSTKWAFQTVRVLAGTWIEASAWAKPSGGEAFVRLSWYASEDGSGQAMDSDDSAVVTTSSSFQEMTTGSVQVPAEARTAKVRLMLRPYSEAAATALFDDAALKPAEPVPGSPEGAVSSPSRGSRTRSARSAAAGPAVAAIYGETPEGQDGLSGAPILSNDGRPDDDVRPVPVGEEDDSPWETPLAILVLACLALIGAILFRELVRKE